MARRAGQCAAVARNAGRGEAQVSPRKGKHPGQHANSKMPVTVYMQRQHLDWCKATAPAGHVSNFIDNLIFNTKMRYESKKAKSTIRRQRIEIARLEGLIVRLGGDVDERPVTDETTNEDLQ